MIRVSGLKEELEENVTELSPDGMTPEEQLKEIRKRVLHDGRAAGRMPTRGDYSRARCRRNSRRGLRFTYVLRNRRDFTTTSWKSLSRF